MKRDVTVALNYALNKGFQIHPDALEILESIDSEQLQRIIKEIVREKSRQKLFLINQDDLETFLGIKEDESLKSEFKILFDPTTKVTSAEGVDGYNALFASRFSKLKRIVSNRPEAKMIKSISAVIAAPTLPATRQPGHAEDCSLGPTRVGRARQVMRPHRHTGESDR